MNGKMGGLIFCCYVCNFPPSELHNIHKFCSLPGMWWKIMWFNFADVYKFLFEFISVRFKRVFYCNFSSCKIAYFFALIFMIVKCELNALHLVMRVRFFGVWSGACWFLIDWLVGGLLCKLSDPKLSKFSFSNCQNFPFQTFKIFVFKPSKLSVIK